MAEPNAQEKLTLAYGAVFGRDNEHRTDAQRLVWQDMERRGYFLRSTAIPITDGSVQPQKIEIAEGCRIFFLDTLTLVSRAKFLGIKKHKPSVKTT
jgi:hypothetical protein